MKILIYDPVYSKIIGKDAHLIWPCISFTSEYWKQTPYRKQRHTYEQKMVNKNGYFLTGLIPLILAYSDENNLHCQLELACKVNEYVIHRPNLKGVIFREDQQYLIEQAAKLHRGVLVAPTGSGKTLVALGIMSAFPKTRVLFLCHTKTLIEQTSAELKKFGFKYSICQGAKKDIRGPIVLATIQSFSKILPTLYGTYDIVMVDEAHHISNLETQYAKVLSCVYSPLRFGFTATIPTKKESFFAMVGLLGPVIGETTIDQGVKEGFVAKPKIKILKSNYNQEIRELRNYPAVYEYGIVRNRGRNKLIVDYVKQENSKGNSVLVIVNKLDHGRYLNHLIDKSIFVQGETESVSREEIRLAFNSKEIKCCIATTVWKEGVNIPSLNVIINAAGGKSEIATLQAIGRGLRVTKDKKEITIVDIFDPSHPYLISHFGERISLYCDNNWL